MTPQLGAPDPTMPDGVAMVIDGGLDISSLPELAGRLAVLAESASGLVTVDLCACRYVDPQVAAFLLRAQRWFSDRGALLAFGNCSPETTRLLSLVRESSCVEGETLHDLGWVA